jgi:peptidoglycan/xylan/chitin deacetylase (PgdA/CDA1 family)
MLFITRRAKPIGLADIGASSGCTHTVAVTFDDALESFAENAVPVLLRLNIPATVFAVADALGGMPDWAESYYSTEERVMSAERLTGLPDLITVGSHTLTHADLVVLPQDAAGREISESKMKLEVLLCRPVKFFSFPFGTFDAVNVRQCREAGYDRVFTTVPIPGAPGQFVVGRVAADPWDWWLEFRLKVAGAYRWMPYASAAKHRIRASFSASNQEKATQMRTLDRSIMARSKLDIRGRK